MSRDLQLSMMLVSITTVALERCAIDVSPITRTCPTRLPIIHILVGGATDRCGVLC